ncbi:MAG TPA: class I mannose-6-phosphate isomerase [Microbacterium sp.]|uniref:class I mannose-6-phosphate isomerase n=1 Tax=Microbacterium sp. TaxID=51671 RepID=UPI002B492F61|nr:class I mannose-6-phosphate isomerase [Microbacterium sp.]HKT56166.1 class I mannose-6-phosphate isomerase [Microbacterium sp.]
MTSVLQPVLLPMNRPTPRPYRGGSAIEGFRRQAPSGDEWAPEDFLASTVTTFGSTEEGLTVVDGRFLRDLIEADPVGYLGEEHVARFGADPQLLCKLLHTGERLFVHAHPDALFARRELGAPTGKTEAWVILAADETAGSSAWLGFTEDVPEEQLTRWFDTQDSAAMLAAMNEVELHPGDTLFVPAGVPHAIGEGVLLLELQEPADLSVILEYAPFERLRREDGLLGLDPATALRCVDRRAFGPARLADAVGALSGRSRATLFPEDAQSYFRAEALALRHGVEEHLSARFCVLVVTAGAGSLAWRDDRLALEAGDVVLVPHGAGEVRLSGDMRVTRCMPPSAA